ncbi:hypothetical protein [Peribacillus asahii]|nr:hypothetical protein [Peribacillus asahii]USK60385.1 hypothetical protein LIT37_03265 [Peribacillus asahii]
METKTREPKDSLIVESLVKKGGFIEEEMKEIYLEIEEINQNKEGS